MIAMAAFQSFLWRYTNQGSILIGTPSPGVTKSKLKI